MRRRPRDDGAAAVEFALVMPVLVLLVLGIIDFGIFFADSLAVKGGVREGARDAVVNDSRVCPTASPASLDCLAADIRDDLGAVGSTVAVRIDVLEDPESGPENGWAEGNTLRVCAVADGGALTGFTPVPDQIADRVSMRIEHDVPANGTVGQAGSPVGGWASRC